MAQRLGQARRCRLASCPCSRQDQLSAAREEAAASSALSSRSPLRRLDHLSLEGVSTECPARRRLRGHRRALIEQYLHDQAAFARALHFVVEDSCVARQTSQPPSSAA